MRAEAPIINEMERLLDEYFKEIDSVRKRGLLANNTAKTYLLHSDNFVRWCKRQFEPGERKKHSAERYYNRIV